MALCGEWQKMQTWVTVVECTPVPVVERLCFESATERAMAVPVQRKHNMIAIDNFIIISLSQIVISYQWHPKQDDLNLT